jgi:Tfp pilus assembly protein FimV
VKRTWVLRLAAPAAFLAGLTIAVLLVRAGLRHGDGTTASTAATPPAPGLTSTFTIPVGSTTTSAPKRYYTVQSGDTYGSIAAKNGTTVTQLEQLNPGISSNSLSVGQRIRVK